VVPWVPAERVDLLVVTQGDEAIVVREGIELESVRGSGLRAAGASELRLEAAPIAARLRDAAGATRARARARLYMASLLVGVMRAASDFSRDYAQEREAFGRPIAHHQGLAFLIIDMRAAVDGARLLLHEAAWRVDAELPCDAAAAGAFAEAIDASLLVGPNGVQILGGHGFMQDYPVEKYMREARVLGLTLGGGDAAREEAGRALCEEPGRVALSPVEGGPWSS
jgi:alkylation response protein AidB-like acyl-CoA dehydrogenase